MCSNIYKYIVWAMTVVLLVLFIFVGGPAFSKWFLGDLYQVDSYDDGEVQILKDGRVYTSIDNKVVYIAKNLLYYRKTEDLLILCEPNKMNWSYSHERKLEPDVTSALYAKYNRWNYKITIYDKKEVSTRVYFSETPELPFTPNFRLLNIYNEPIDESDFKAITKPGLWTYLVPEPTR